MTDGEALLAAILANPAEDTPRLVYADWLEEHGREERAEFIRVQCELARPLCTSCRACGKPVENDRIADGCPCNSPRGVNHGLVPAYVCTCPECDPEQTGSVRARPADVERLRNRERALLLHFPAAPYWGIPDSLTDSHPHRDLPTSEPGIRCHGFGVREVRFDFRRGFAHAVTCEAADWLAHGDAIRAAHPVTRVRLTTAPTLADLPKLRNKYGFRGQIDAKWWAGVLGDEWPGVTFELPPA